MAMLIRITMIVITTISSTKVKPRRPLLPLRIGRSIGRFLVRLGVHIEYVLAAPTICCGIVLVAPHAPFGRVGERIVRNAAQQLDLLVVGGAADLHSIHQVLQRLRPAIGALLHQAEHAHVAIVFVLVDGQAHVVERIAQRALALRAHLGPRQRHRHAGEDQHDGERHDQFHQGQSTLLPPPHRASHFIVTVSAALRLPIAPPRESFTASDGIVTIPLPAPTAWKLSVTSVPVAAVTPGLPGATFRATLAAPRSFCMFLAKTGGWPPRESIPPSMMSFR